MTTNEIYNELNERPELRSFFKTLLALPEDQRDKAVQLAREYLTQRAK